MQLNSLDYTIEVAYFSDFQIAWTRMKSLCDDQGSCMCGVTCVTVKQSLITPWLAHQTMGKALLSPSGTEYGYDSRQCSLVTSTWSALFRQDDHMLNSVLLRTMPLRWILKPNNVPSELFFIRISPTVFQEHSHSLLLHSNLTFNHLSLLKAPTCS